MVQNSSFKYKCTFACQCFYFMRLYAAAAVWFNAICVEFGRAVMCMVVAARSVRGKYINLYTKETTKYKMYRE